MSWGSINTVGLGANLAGVILLFYFGMPFRVEAGGSEQFITVSVHNPGEQEASAYFRGMGYFGLALIVAGTALQIWVSLMTM
jgi:hypothetical protein